MPATATSRSCCKCGVRLFEYPHTLLHQKVMTIDGVWSAVGSSNFDDRSFETNDEITLGILDAALARQLDAIFEKYVPRAEEIAAGALAEARALAQAQGQHLLPDQRAALTHRVSGPSAFCCSFRAPGRLVS